MTEEHPTPPVWIGDAEAWERQRRISEFVANRPPQQPLSERYDWERENSTAEHPGGTGLRRVRPRSVLAQVPRAMRLAEIVCRRLSGQPRVVALVYPRGAPLERCDVLTEHDNGSTPVGANFVVFCACGHTHYIDGGRLRSSLLNLPQSRKVPTLDAAALVVVTEPD